MEASQLETTMDSISSLPPLTKTWLLDGPLSSHVEAYMANLERGSYSRQSFRSHIDTLAHFAHWMARCTLTAGQLDEDCVHQFLNFHLPSCDCHSMALRNHGQLRAGLGLLLEVLRQERVIAELGAVKVVAVKKFDAQAANFSG